MKAEGATGKLDCNGSIATANLTLKNNIITTVSHILWSYDCARLKGPQQCRFIYLVENREYSVGVEKSLATGFKCPEKPSRLQDWAVLKLKGPVVGLTPYNVPGANDTRLAKNKNVVSVAAMSIDFVRPNPQSGRPENPKHVENCSVEKLFGGMFPLAVSSNCGNSSGSSGGALLDPDLRSPTLLAITTNNEESPQLVNQAIKSGTPNVAPYDEQSWANRGIPLNGRFLEAIINAN